MQSREVISNKHYAQNLRKDIEGFARFLLTRALGNSTKASNYVSTLVRCVMVE